MNDAHIARDREAKRQRALNRRAEVRRLNRHIAHLRNCLSNEWENRQRERHRRIDAENAVKEMRAERAAAWTCYCWWCKVTRRFRVVR